MNKSKSAFKTIAEVADELGVATHVLRFWETKFNQIKPMKTSGGRRYYRPDDVEVIKLIKSLLYNNRYTIEGAQQLIKAKGLKNLLGEEEIQKDFFEESIVRENNAIKEDQTSVVSSAVLSGVAEAIDELKVLRAKLSNF
ncbi:MAG: MerR family transcriptional regulator [Alphaproteobacteria bacterium]|nr:MerR family transcriptional regulator [Alphaproteobacteria bacterium]